MVPQGTVQLRLLDLAQEELIQGVRSVGRVTCKLLVVIRGSQDIRGDVDAAYVSRDTNRHLHGYGELSLKILDGDPQRHRDGAEIDIGVGDGDIDKPML